MMMDDEIQVERDDKGIITVRGLREQEVELFRLLTQSPLDFGRIVCIVYYQEGLIVKAELEKVVESIR